MKHLHEIKTPELAELMQTTHSFASNVKHGRRKMPIKQCIKVSKKFGIPLHELRPDVYPSPEDHVF